MAEMQTGVLTLPELLTTNSPLAAGHYFSWPQVTYRVYLLHAVQETKGLNPAVLNNSLHFYYFKPRMTGPFPLKTNQNELKQNQTLKQSSHSIHFLFNVFFHHECNSPAHAFFFFVL